MTAQDNKIYFSSVINSEVGREVYSYDLDFMLSNVTSNTLEGISLVPMSNSYWVENPHNQNISIQIFNMSGQVLENRKSNATEYIEWNESGIFILEISNGQSSVTRKIFRP